MDNIVTRTLLSPRELAEAIGVSESSIKRWADEGTVRAVRTAGGHRRIPIDDAVHFIRTSGQRVQRPDILGLAEVAAFTETPPPHGNEDSMLLDFLRRGSTAEARGMIMSLYLDGWSVAQIVDGPLQSAMQRLGELWQDDPNGIFLEHRATDIAIQSLNHIRSLLPIPHPSAPVALGGAPPSDPYILPTLAVAAVLSSIGLRTMNLGPETPLATLEGALDQVRPRLLWLSVTTVEHPEKLEAQLAGLTEAASQRDCVLVIGGRSARRLNITADARLFIGRSMAELEAFTRGLALSSASSRAR